METQVHQAMSVMGRVAQVAGEQGTARDRGAEVLEELRRLIPFEAAELTTFNPIDGSVEEIVAGGYDQEVLDGLRSDRFLELMYSLGLPDSGMPVRMKDLPGDMYDNWAVSELLLPAGYAEGMTMALRTPDGRFTGVLNLSTTTKEHPSDIARAAMAQLCTALGNLADPVRSGRWLAMLLGAESMAVGLDHAGGIVRLPGISTHPLLDDGSDLVETAQITAGRLQTWSSFVWPDQDDWYRVRIVPCRADQHLCAVLSIDEVSLGALSRREIEVLTLAAEGMSNSEIGDALVISSRTVGTHIEHILEKVGAPNRAAAVAHAIREGLVLGRVQRYDLP